MNRSKRIIVVGVTFVLFMMMVGIVVCFKANDGAGDKRAFKTEVNIKSSSPVLTSQLPSDFVDRELAEYEILGKWHVVGEDGYVIAQKDGELWSTYYNKKEKSVGVLVPLKQEVKDGDTIIYSEQSFSGEYFVIRAKGLYLYGNNDLEPVVWPND